MANNVTAYGRQQVEWPDLGSDPGVTLHSQIVAAIGYLSNNVTGRWSGSVSFAIGQTVQIEHNFDQTLANLKIVFVEGGITLSQFNAEAALTVTQVDTNTIQIENISGAPRTFQIYVYPHFSNIRGSDLDDDIDIATSGSIHFGEILSSQQSTNTQTGTGITLNSPDKLHIVLTDSGLSYIEGIAAPSPAKGVVAIFTNATGGLVSFANDTGTSSNRILTGTNEAIVLQENASVLVKYDTISLKWRVIGSTAIPESIKVYPNVFVSAIGLGDVTTLSAAITLLPPSGGVILVMDNLIVPTSVTLPENTKLIGRGKNATVTFTGAFGLITSKNVVIEDIVLAATGATKICTLNGDNNVVSKCRFEAPSENASAMCIDVASDGNHIGECVFTGVVSPSLATGINFRLGTSENTESNNIFST
jgi:hypothetical protein